MKETEMIEKHERNREIREAYKKQRDQRSITETETRYAGNKQERPDTQTREA
jgi:hypothetical protein